jgi:hypothetical protein
VPPGYFLPAAICRRGHVEATNTKTRADLSERCATCGAVVLVKCPVCGHRLRGRFYVARVIVTQDYEPPDFCDGCGAPFPWVSRQGRIYELMNLLDDSELDPATELEVREQLEALSNPDVPDDEAARRWAKIKEKAPTLWEKTGAQRIIETVVTAAIKAQLDIK